MIKTNLHNHAVVERQSFYFESSMSKLKMRKDGPPSMSSCWMSEGHHKLMHQWGKRQIRMLIVRKSDVDTEMMRDNLAGLTLLSV